MIGRLCVRVSGSGFKSPNPKYSFISRHVALASRVMLHLTSPPRLAAKLLSGKLAEFTAAAQSLFNQPHSMFLFFSVLFFPLFLMPTSKMAFHGWVSSSTSLRVSVASFERSLL